VQKRCRPANSDARQREWIWLTTRIDPTACCRCSSSITGPGDHLDSRIIETPIGVTEVLHAPLLRQQRLQFLSRTTNLRFELLRVNLREIGVTACV
jgi:hypothetical protein